MVSPNKYSRAVVEATTNTANLRLNGYRGHIISLLQLSLSLLGSHDRLHVTILCTAESHTKVLKQLDRHRHLSPEVRRRVQVLCTKEEARPACVPEDWVEPTAVNAPGAAAILEDLILVKGNGAVGDRFRITPRIIIYDVRVISSSACSL
jgi:hypothetical protein